MAKTLLEGIRILDFGSFMAGPVGAMMLAQMGAEVIKVENPRRPEGGRFFINAPTAPTPDPKYGGQFFDVNNMNKKSITADFSKKEGQQIILDLAAKSDVIIENMTPGTIAKYGLGYEDIKKVNPQIIYVSSCACGQFGPDRDYVGYAALFANKAGLGHITGYPDQPPSQFVGSVDIRSAVNTVIAVNSALIYRELSGEGQYCDLASQEVIASQIGDVYMDYIINGSVQTRSGNHREGYAPNNAYRCKGEDNWISISNQTEDEWIKLSSAIGMPELIDDPRFSDYESRYVNQDELDSILEGWSVNYEDREAMELLQSAGVPSAFTLNGQRLSKDPHVVERGIFAYIDHPALGQDFVVNPSWRFSKTPAKNTRHAPVFGEHTDDLLKNLLGYSDEKIIVLRENGIV